MTYNTPQIVEVYALPTIQSTKKTISVKAKACVCNSECSGKEVCEKYPITQPIVNGATCVVNGDPHYKPFAHKEYDFQPVGDAYLFKSNLLTIQARTFPCGKDVTCVGAVAIRYGKSAIIFETPSDKKLLSTSRITPQNDNECKVLAIDGDSVSYCLLYLMLFISVKQLIMCSTMVLKLL